MKGASGAGKTTLLNVLNFRNRGNLKISGDVKINGNVIRKRAEIASISGYVQQEDMFIGYLKVKEQLKFQVFRNL
jgi:ABC-type multidrug transport system ATPase subunit